MLSNRHSLKRSGLFFRSFRSICVRGVAYCLCSGWTVLLRLSLRSIHFEVRTEDYLKLKILLPSTANQLLLCVWNTKLTTCERKARQRRFFIRYVYPMGCCSLAFLVCCSNQRQIRVWRGQEGVINEEKNKLFHGRWECTSGMQVNNISSIKT